MTADQREQAPAADPALDALHRVEAEGSGIPENPLKSAFYTDIATIREALADRIPPAEARSLLNRPGSVLPTAQVNALYAKLTGIADRDEVTR